MNRFIVSLGCAAALVMSTNPALAQGRGNGGSKVKTTGAAVKAGGSAHGGGSKTKTTTTAHGGKTHGPTTKAAHGGGSTTTAGTKTTGSKNKTTAAETTSSGTSTKQTTTTTTTTPATLSAVQKKLQRNTNLASKLESRLPAGMTLMAASEGFTSLGQFVSTVNAAHNHDLDFTKLKTDILDEGMSLGQAMKDQRTSLDGTTEAARATRDADALIKSTETVSSTDSTTKAKNRSSASPRR